MITGSIGTAADADWFSFTIGGRNEANTIVLDGDVTNHDLLINPAMAIFKPNGSLLDADKQSVRNHDGYIVIELDSLGAGTYYAGPCRPRTQSKPANTSSPITWKTTQVSWNTPLPP